MAAIQANISKGREVEFYNRVVTNDPTNSALIMFVLASGGDALATLQDYDTLSAVLAGPSNEVTNSGYARKVLTNADLAAWAPDDTNNWTLLVLPLQTFTTIGAGDTWDIVGIGYDNDATGGTDANIVPVTFAELRYQGTAISPPGGGNVIVDYSNGWITAT
jgi:hypothetical protein